MAYSVLFTECLFFAFALFGFFVDSTNVEDVVATDEDFTEMSGESAVDVLFRVAKLEVHVAVDGHQVAFVFHAPLQLDLDGLAGEGVQKWLYGDAILDILSSTKMNEMHHDPLG